MYQEERLYQITQLLKQRKSLSKTEIMESFDISRDTARRDIVSLVEQGMAIRTHGGIAPVELQLEVPSYSKRATLNQEIKKKLAKQAAAHLSRHRVCFFDESTTILELCDYVPEELDVYADIQFDADALLMKWADKIITAEMIAEELLAMPENDPSEFLAPYRPGGSRSDSPVHFHWDNFAQGKVAYVPVRYISFREAVALIKSAGGIPVIAHAGVNFRNCLERVPELIDAGAEGIEIYNTYHTPEQSRYLRGIAEEHKLKMTCGSDFHGKNKPDVRLGVFPMGSVEEIGT